jgi:hypothetical protein
MVITPEVSNHRNRFLQHLNIWRLISNSRRGDGNKPDENLVAVLDVLRLLDDGTVTTDVQDADDKSSMD